MRRVDRFEVIVRLEASFLQTDLDLLCVVLRGVVSGGSGADKIQVGFVR
jgi:NAD-dependent oxidoreductase involved in siderophore biosynthesis